MDNQVDQATQHVRSILEQTGEPKATLTESMLVEGNMKKVDREQFAQAVKGLDGVADEGGGSNTSVMTYKDESGTIVAQAVYQKPQGGGKVETTYMVAESIDITEMDEVGEVHPKRQAILDEYTVDPNGVIRDPGKFEGEPIYAPYFYDALMNGGSDSTEYDGDTPIDVFDVSDEDRQIFPELQGVSEVRCYESEQGFFYAETR